jgi:hypothetical protein
MIPESQRGTPRPFAVSLRIHAGNEPLDIDEVATVLDIQEEDLAVGSFGGDVDSMLILEFEGVPELVEGSDVETWGRRGFKSAIDWLAERSPDAFQDITAMGHRVDLLVEAHSGKVPDLLDEQLQRVGLELVRQGQD